MVCMQMQDDWCDLTICWTRAESYQVNRVVQIRGPVQLATGDMHKTRPNAYM